MGRRQRVPVGLRIALAASAVAVLLLVSSMAAGAVPPPQFNCVASQATSFSNATDVAIPDPPDPTVAPVPATLTIIVSGLTGTISDVDVMTRIPHAAPVDLDITLTAPNGKVIELSIGNGGTAANAFNGTTWDDDADPDGASTATTNDGLATDHNYVANVVASPLVPQEALAVFMGDNPNGTWTLTVTDGAPADIGLIDEWSLSIATDETGPALGAASSTSAPFMAIPDGGTVSTSVQLARGNRRVSSLSTFFVAFEYTGLGDLTVMLQSPAGTLVTLTSRNGGTADVPSGHLRWRLPLAAIAGFGVPDPITRVDFAQPFLPSDFAPEESFGAFAGEDPNGTWILTATDAGLIPGGGSVGSWTVVTRGRECVGAAKLTALAGPEPSARIGDVVTYEGTIASNGSGLAHDVLLGVSFPRQVRIKQMDPGPGGICIGPGRIVNCRWNGPTPPGAARTARISVEVFVVGPVTVGAFMVVKNGTTTRPVTESVQHGPVVFLPSERRAFNGRRCTVLGSLAADNFQSYPRPAGPQVLCGLAGNDRMNGGTLDDTIDGGAGKDVIRGDRGNDHINGGPGADRIWGGRGNDRIEGGSGTDTIKGEDGNDRIDGGPDADTIYGGPGADELRGRGGADRLLGELGRDRLFGGPGRDQLFGGLGRDFGALGNDSLVGIEQIR